MEAEPAETKHCKNCKRDIATSNFLMHEVHCKRNIILCKTCQEPVPFTEMDAHVLEYHTPITCDLCRSDVDKDKYDQHKSDLCPKRAVPCTYCSMECSSCDLPSHEEYCGSRTEACPICSQYVMKKDLDQHEATNCSYPAPPKSHTLPNLASPISAFTLNEFGRMMNNTYQTPRRDRRVDDRLKQTSPPHLIRNVVSSRVGGPNTENDELLAQYLANDMDSLTFDPPSDLDHLRDRNLEAVGAMHARMPSRGLRRDNVTPSGMVLPCEFCHEPFPMDCIFQHQNACELKTPYIEEMPQWPPEKEKFDFHSAPADPPVGFDGGEVMLPCEFCGHPFPEDQLIVHQSHCMEETGSATGEGDSPNLLVHKNPLSSAASARRKLVKNATATRSQKNRESRRQADPAPPRDSKSEEDPFKFEVPYVEAAPRLNPSSSFGAASSEGPSRAPRKSSLNSVNNSVKARGQRQSPLYARAPRVPLVRNDLSAPRDAGGFGSGGQRFSHHRVNPSRRPTATNADLPPEEDTPPYVPSFAPPQSGRSSTEARRRSLRK